MADDALKNIIQGGLIVVGWMVVHRLSARREKEKARREMIAKAADAISDEVTKLFAAARAYHTSERDVPAEQNIKITLQDLSARTTLLSEVCDDEAELALCRSALLAAKKAITGQHFEDEHTGSLPGGAPQMQDIAAEVLRAKRYFLQLKHKQFPKK